jgi:hypothetical protein
MAIKELFYDNRPQVLLDPRASQRIDPRFTFTRNSTATYTDENGNFRTAGINEPRIHYINGEAQGLALHPTLTNLIDRGVTFVSSGWTPNYLASLGNTFPAPDGSNTAVKLAPIATRTNGTTNETTTGIVGSPFLHTFSIFAKAAELSSSISIYVAGGNENSITVNLASGSITSEGYNVASSLIERLADGWFRLSVTAKPSASSIPGRFSGIGVNEADGSGTQGAYFWGAQLEQSGGPTSYSYNDTRAADLLSIESPLPASGSVYIDARAISVNENDTLLSLKNSSNDKIDLAYLSNATTYNSLALIANYDGTSKSSLPLPVPTTDRERNIITWGANNYQYTRDSSRFAASLSSSVPTGLNQLSIGHDAVDPTKAFNGYINTVYAWSGELTPAVAEALVRNDLDPINADTYSPVGPAGSLALVINTQGATASGEKTFTLPAESAANDNDIVITWGDGTESGLDGTDAEVGAAGLTHTYPAAGIYPVWVEGQMQNIQFNNIANAPDLLQIAAWGTTANGNDVFRTPSTMANAFYGCTQMNFSTSARTTNLPDTSAVTNWYRAFRNCSSITGTFPAFNFSAATTFQEAWYGCSGMTSFVAAGDQTQNVTNFGSAWYNCTGLTSFPLINTAAGTNFVAAWRNCSSLTDFPLINTAAGTNFSSAWEDCSGLTDFPLINTAAGTNFDSAWLGCSSLTDFPLINTAAGTTFVAAWRNCSSLTTFPLINTAAGTNFSNAWRNCSSLTSFPLINTAAGTNFSSAWEDCSSLTTFPLINTAAGTNFSSTWFNCSDLTDFPLINTAAGTAFGSAWRNCSSLTDFPLINTAASTNFSYAWYICSSLTSFPANFFDSWTGTPSNSCFYRTWDGCSSLTPASVVNILDSIAASGQSAPSGTATGNKEITIDYNTSTGHPYGASSVGGVLDPVPAAIATLKGNGWDVVLNGVSQ